MRKFLIMALSGLFLSYSAVEAFAGDDVYVDLSVLNDIGGSSSPSYAPTYAPTFAPTYVPEHVRTEPRFPIVKKKASRPASKKAAKPAASKKAVIKPAKKAVSTVKPEKRQLKIKQISIKDKEEKITIPAKPTDIMTENPVVPTELKTSPAEREFVAGVSEKVDNGPFQSEEKAPAEKVSSAPVVPVASETMEIIEVEKTTEPQENSSANASPVIPLMFESESVSPTVTPTAEPETPAAEVEPLLPIKQQAADVAKIKREIIFAEGSDTLSEAAKEKIDEAVASFENPKINKIAILAYNYDNGQDVFRKKRQSLNRAIEIRSHLLTKGYKNFSIKVINITDDAPRGNVVEIDEIK